MDPEGGGDPVLYGTQQPQVVRVGKVKFKLVNVIIHIDFKI